jgi:sarcosine oxidase delta subunit
MGNQEKLATFVYTSEKTKGAIKRNWQHLCTRQRKPKGQSRETGNICVHVRENQRGNQEKMATFVYTSEKTKGAIKRN